MKNPLYIQIKKDIRSGETTEVMETVIFTKIHEKPIRTSGMSQLKDYMEVIAHQNFFEFSSKSPLGFTCNATDYYLMRDILIKSVIEN